MKIKYKLYESSEQKTKANELIYFDFNEIVYKFKKWYEEQVEDDEHLVGVFDTKQEALDVFNQQLEVWNGFEDNNDYVCYKFFDLVTVNEDNDVVDVIFSNKINLITKRV